MAGCVRDTAGATGEYGARPTGASSTATPASARFAHQRDALVNDLVRDGITDAAVVRAMRAVPRHEFVPMEIRARAYEDRPLPIGDGQTISQPYIVALMTQLAHLTPRSRVLEIGTGSGYQAAVLAQIAARVYTIEIVEPLARRSRATLESLGYRNIQFRLGDGYQGWPEAAPFDAILVTAAAPALPQPLTDQLAVGGRLVIPVGEASQDLMVVTRTERGLQERSVTPVLFVPMTGKIRQR